MEDILMPLNARAPSTEAPGRRASAGHAAAKASRIVKDFNGKDGVEAKLLRDPDQQKRLWTVRESGLGATAYVPGDPDTWEGWEDTAVHRDNLGGHLRELRALFNKYDYESTFYGHFGDGLVHCRIDFHLREVEGLEKWRRFIDEAADLVVRYNGSFSGEHGDGQAKAALLEKMYGPELIQAFREFKSIWDPAWKMNPGKVIDPFPITSNLRIGPGYNPPDFDTHFDFADDKGMFAHATRRCCPPCEFRLSAITSRGRRHSPSAALSSETRAWNCPPS
jgi:FAD/FMN-containing dehydrogenase